MGALMVWGRYIQTGLRDSSALIRKEMQAALRDPAWVSEALGVERDQPMVQAVMEEANTLKRDSKLAPRVFPVVGRSSSRAWTKAVMATRVMISTGPGSTKSPGIRVWSMRP